MNLKHRAGLGIAVAIGVAMLLVVMVGRSPSPTQEFTAAAKSPRPGIDRLERDNRKLSKSGIFLAANGGTINKQRPVALINPTPANVDYIRAHYRVRVSNRPAKALAGACPEVLVMPNESQQTTPNVIGLDVGQAVDAVKSSGLLASTTGCHGLPTGSPAPKSWHIDALTRIVQQCPAPGSVVSGHTFVDIVGEVRLPGGFVYRTQPLSKKTSCSTR